MTALTGMSHPDLSRTEQDSEAPLSPIYLDNQASTRPDPRVVEAMLPWLSVLHANPHSDHFAGQRAMAAVERARSQVADEIGASPSEIIFTSGATESNNLALKGILRAARRRGNHLVVSSIEHKSVLETAKQLQKEDIEVSFVPVNADGIVDLEALRCSLRPDTSLVSIMLANNEIGVVQPIEAIGAVCREAMVPLHVDAAQGFGKIPIDVNSLSIDMLSMSGHKVYAPGGIGALFVSDGLQPRPVPAVTGGGQEHGIRSGSVPAYLVVAFAEATRLASVHRETEIFRLNRLREGLIQKLSSRGIAFSPVGDQRRTLPGTVSLMFPGIDADRLIGAVQPRLAISSGSACAGGEIQPSHVLLALGLTLDQAASVVRFAVGRFNTEGEVEQAANLISWAIRSQAE